MMKVYLASPFFNEKEIKIYEEVIDILRNKNSLDVFVPREHSIPNGWGMSNQLWGEAVFATDLVALDRCDVVVVLNWGMYSDSGTAWECGYAYAKGKTVINVLCGDEKDFSLMMLNGTSKFLTLGQLKSYWFKGLLKGRVELVYPQINQK